MSHTEIGRATNQESVKHYLFLLLVLALAHALFPLLNTAASLSGFVVMLKEHSSHN